MDVLIIGDNTWDDLIFGDNTWDVLILLGCFGNMDVLIFGDMLEI